MINSCYKFTSPFTCVPATFYCNSAMINPFLKTGRNIYDVRKLCPHHPDNPDCYDIIYDIQTYLNQPDVQDILGVDVPFKTCKRNINRNFMLSGDMMHPYVNYVGPLLDSGVKVLVYAGDADYICNWIGNKAWVMKLDWSGKDKFDASKDLVWTSKKTGRAAGEWRMSGNLAFLRVYEAGHMVQTFYSNPRFLMINLNIPLSSLRCGFMAITHPMLFEDLVDPPEEQIFCLIEYTA